MESITEQGWQGLYKEDFRTFHFQERCTLRLDKRHDVDTHHCLKSIRNNIRFKYAKLGREICI